MVAVHPDGAHIYVVHQGDNDLYVLDAIDYRLLSDCVWEVCLCG